MAYSFISLGQAKAALARRLSDPLMQFWTSAELGAYIAESLQSFNALANFYRQEFTFNSRPDVTWYDLTDSVNLPNTLRPLTETDQTLLSLIEYHLLEPQTASYPLTWTGSLQFTVTDLLNAIQQTRDEVLSDSGCTIIQAYIAALAGRTYLNENVLSLRRVAWLPASVFGFASNTLLPSDLWSQQSFEPGFPQAAPGVPLTYRQSTEPPLGFDVDVQPAVPGQYDVLTIEAGNDLSINTSSVLTIPDDWCWVAKWGALAQLFGRDSVSGDPFRAQYCMARYKQGIQAMRMAPALLAARINNVPMIVEAVTNGDFYDANWQAQAHGSPRAIYYAGLNQIALGPAPSTNGYSITASVVRNMILPASDADKLQVGRDDIAAVLDESQHMAMLKCGGAEFAQTFPLHGNFLQRCAFHNSKLAALSLYLEFLNGLGQSDDQLHPVFQGVDPASAKG